MSNMKQLALSDSNLIINELIVYGILIFCWYRINM